MEYHSEDLSNKNAEDWKKVNEDSEDGSFFHSLEWKQILERSYKYKNHCFLVYRNDKPVAICPFYEASINGILGVISLPDSDCNHLIITDQYDPLIVYQILERCNKIAKENGLYFILITTLSDLTKDHFGEYNPLPFPVGGNMMLNLEENSPDKIWNEIFCKRDRKHIRRFEKDGFVFKELKSINEIKTFYKYYKINLESVNAAPYPFSHFEYLLKIYSSKEMNISLLYNNKIIAGGQLAFLDDSKKTIYLRYLSLNRELPNRYRPTTYMRWNWVRKASEMGYSRICFGRTPPDPNDIHYRLKEKFGCYFEKEHSIIFPRSYLFKIGYNLYYNFYNFKKKFLSR